MYQNVVDDEWIDDRANALRCGTHDIKLARRKTTVAWHQRKQQSRKNAKC